MIVINNGMNADTKRHLPCSVVVEAAAEGPRLPAGLGRNQGADRGAAVGRRRAGNPRARGGGPRELPVGQAPHRWNPATVGLSTYIACRQVTRG